MTEQELRRLSKMILKELLPAVKLEIAKEIEKGADQVFSLDEAAVYLHTSKYWLYKRIDQIPHVQQKRGGKLLFLKSKLDDYMRSL